MDYDICVFGGCSVDIMYYGNEDGTFNEQPDKIVPGGKASNQAVAASRAGSKVTIITRLGKDKLGDTILDNLQYNGVFTNYVEMVEGLENDSAKIYIDPFTKDKETLKKNGAISSISKEIVERYKDVFLNSKIIMCQTKVEKEVFVELIEFCHKYNKTLVLTPCCPEKIKLMDKKNIDLIDKITYITANQKECEIIFGTKNIEECVSKYPNKLIVTLGSDGVIYHNGTEIIEIPSRVVDVKDTTGAGDTFAGNFVSALVKGYNLHDAIERAEIASTMKVQKETAQAGMPYKEELDKYIEKNI